MVRIASKPIDDLNTQLSRFTSLLTRYYFFVFMLVIAGAFFFRRESLARETLGTPAGGSVAAVAVVVVAVLASITNLRVVQADIVFKQAEPYVKQNSWKVAIDIYDRANSLAPSEDYYYLFLGRAYLENAQSLTDTTQREDFITKAKQDLLKAQSLNPLNIDHTANLARLYGLWSAYATDTQVRAERAQTASDYYARAVVISPNNARLWDEWGQLYLNTLKNPAEALKRYDHSLTVDPYYDWTYALLGDYTVRLAQSAGGEDEQRQLWLKAAGYYQKALEEASPSDVASRVSYLDRLSDLYIQLKDYQSAATTIETSLAQRTKTADTWKLFEKLATLYYQLGDTPKALEYATQALASAPQSEKERLQTMVATIQAQPAGQP
jgi:tetratricopeptide (TPR) repeat protein